MRLLALLTSLVCFTATAVAGPLVQPITFTDFVAGARHLSSGVCVTKVGTLHCDRVHRDNQEYLIMYDEDRVPRLIVRRSDNVVIWVASERI